MKNTADIIAVIRLFSSKDGGRSGPTPKDKLHCMMVLGEQHFDVRIHLDNIGALQPGQDATVPISFFSLDLAKHLVHRGAKFKLREMKVIGEGTIEEVMFVT